MRVVRRALAVGPLPRGGRQAAPQQHGDLAARVAPAANQGAGKLAQLAFPLGVGRHGHRRAHGRHGQAALVTREGRVAEEDRLLMPLNESGDLGTARVAAEAQFVGEEEPPRHGRVLVRHAEADGVGEVRRVRRVAPRPVVDHAARLHGHVVGHRHPHRRVRLDHRAQPMLPVHEVALGVDADRLVGQLPGPAGHVPRVALHRPGPEVPVVHVPLEQHLRHVRRDRLDVELDVERLIRDRVQRLEPSRLRRLLESFDLVRRHGVPSVAFTSWCAASWTISRAFGFSAPLRTTPRRVRAT